MQSSVLHSQPKSTVGTPAYVAPEVLSRKEYDGKVHTKLLTNDDEINNINLFIRNHITNTIKYEF